MGKKRGIVYDLYEGSKYSNLNLVFVHGSGCNKTFLTAISQEVKEYNSYFIDLPGHGGSDSTGYSAENYISSISDFVSDLDNVILIGHSLGGTLVLGTLANNIPSVKGGVIISSGASFPKLNKDLLKKIHQGIVDKDYLLYCFGHLDNVLVKEAIESLECDDIIIKDFIIDEIINVENHLNNIKVPITIIVGDKDELTPMEYSEYLNKNVENSKLIIVKNAKHMLPVAEKEQIGKVIIELINKVLL